MLTVSADRLVDLIKGWGVLYDLPLQTIGRLNPYWSAEDILRHDGFSAQDKLRLVLSMEFFDARFLQEFMLICAMKLIKKVPIPSPKITYALEIKRDWIRGKATDGQLITAIADASSVERRLEFAPDWRTCDKLNAKAIEAAVMAVHFKSEENADNCSRLVMYVITAEKQVKLLKSMIRIMKK